MLPLRNSSQFTLNNVRKQFGRFQKVKRDNMEAQQKLQKSMCSSKMSMNFFKLRPVRSFKIQKIPSPLDQQKFTYVIEKQDSAASNNRRLISFK